MRLTFVTTIWKRPALTNFVFEYYNNLRADLAKTVKLDLIAVGSEGENSKQIATRNGWEYMEHENQPLNRKWAKGFELAREKDPDGVILIGTDDLLSPGLVKSYAELVGANRENIGLKDTYSLLLSTFQACHWPGYNFKGIRPRKWLYAYKRYNQTAGSGRLFTADTLDRMGWDLWGSNELSKALDRFCTARMKELNLSIKGYCQHELGGRFMSIKTGTQITPFTGTWSLNRRWMDNPVGFVEDSFGRGVAADLFYLHQHRVYT